MFSGFDWASLSITSLKNSSKVLNSSSYFLGSAKGDLAIFKEGTKKYLSEAIESGSKKINLKRCSIASTLYL